MEPPVGSWLDLDYSQLELRVVADREFLREFVGQMQSQRAAMAQRLAVAEKKLENNVSQAIIPAFHVAAGLAELTTMLSMRASMLPPYEAKMVMEAAAGAHQAHSALWSIVEEPGNPAENVRKRIKREAWEADDELRYVAEEGK